MVLLLRLLHSDQKSIKKWNDMCNEILVHVSLKIWNQYFNRILFLVKWSGIRQWSKYFFLKTSLIQAFEVCNHATNALLMLLNYFFLIFEHCVCDAGKSYKYNVICICSQIAIEKCVSLILQRGSRKYCRTIFLYFCIK